MRASSSFQYFLNIKQFSNCGYQRFYVLKVKKVDSFSTEKSSSFLKKYDSKAKTVFLNSCCKVLLLKMMKCSAFQEIVNVACA